MKLEFSWGALWVGRVDGSRAVTSTRLFHPAVYAAMLTLIAACVRFPPGKRE
jgi:hypothetical protein